MFQRKPSFRRASTSFSSTSRRDLYINNSEYNAQFSFPSNEIKTSKYTCHNFLPKALILQFKRAANVYFLMIAILQSIPIISPLSPFSAIAPFVIVIGLSMFREGLEDRERHKSDVQTNSQKCLKYDKGGFKEIFWKDVQVGDILKILEMDILPADMVVIASSFDDGSCYLETSSLDGEKNLKPKNSLTVLNKFFIDLPIRIHGKINCLKPNSNLYQFDGFIDLFNNENEKSELTGKNLLVRGSRLKSTKWVYGVVIYTGIDTKIMKNSEDSRFKQSEMEYQTNLFIMAIFYLQTLVCVASGIMNFIWNHFNEDNHEYLDLIYKPKLRAVLSFFTYFLLNNTMIPISLIVSLEFIKVFQAYFIKQDDDFKKSDNENSISVFSSTLNESLGQIEYIFSDKTGTLTCNKMEFKFALVGNMLFGDENIFNNKNSLVRKPTYFDSKGGIEYTFDDKKLTQIFLKRKNEDILNWSFYNDNEEKNIYIIKDQKHLVENFLLLLATCHECILDLSTESEIIRYQGPSPDEIALVDAARHMGCIFEGRSGEILKINFFGKNEEIEILESFEFDSDRKRMTVIIKHDGVIKLFCKGADSIILSRLKENSREIENQLFLVENQKHLDEFSKKGLRTLCLAMKVIEFSEWNKYSILLNDAKKNQNKNELERNLYLIGTTALEDRLQDQVPETIQELLKANIKICMLTGDKLETAENIAKSCNLITNEMNIFNLKLSLNYPAPKIQEIKDKLLEFTERSSICIKNEIKKALLIEGETLSYIIREKELRKLYINLVKDFEAVVCCRVTPKQKADVVSLVKTYLKKTTLSVGDGANDVNMIQEADIGIGIYGEEGLRAVQASDYAIAEFKGLWKLIVVHGRWSYLRISETILYFFYKNMIFTIPQFYFSFFSAYSGQSIFDDWYISLYNLIFTCFPLLMRGIFDQDVYYKYLLEKNDSKEIEIKESAKIKQQYSYLYSQKNLLFNKTRFVLFLLEGIFHGLIIFLVHVYSLKNTILCSNGYNTDFWVMSISMFTSIIFIVNMKLSIITQTWINVTWISFLLTSFATFFLYIWISDQLFPIDMSHTLVIMFTSPIFYLNFFICVFPSFGVQMFYYTLVSPRPPLINELREILKEEKEIAKGEEIKKKKETELTNLDISLSETHLKKNLLL